MTNFGLVLLYMPAVLVLDRVDGPTVSSEPL